jgi:cobalt-zinc-cadmium efflux system protein
VTPASPRQEPKPAAAPSRTRIEWARTGWTRTRRLWAVLAADVALVAALVLVGIGAHSLGVLAEGADYLADAAGVAVALLAVRIGRRPGGHPKATRYAAAANAGWLLVLCLLVTAGAVHRLLTGTREVHGLPVLVVSGLAAAVMLAGALLLGGDVDDEQLDPEGAGPPHGRDADVYEALTVRAVLLDTAADAAAATGVAVAGGVILLAGGLYWLDPAVALVISIVVAWHAARLLLHIRRALQD